jgi:hypothetical protein
MAKQPASDEGPADADQVRRGRRVLAGPDSFAELVASSRADLNSPNRSTVPLLAAWREFRPRLDALGNMLGESFERPARYGFEHTEPAKLGRGKSSCTDLMITTRTRALAIEGKYREPRYAKVKTWVAGANAKGQSPKTTPTNSSNREDVLRGWLTTIEDCTGTNGLHEHVDECTYQLIHRTASACAQENKSWRAVAYQCFYDTTPTPPADEYSKQLRNLKMILGSPPDLQFILIGCPFSASERLTALRKRWDAGERDLADEVTEGLLAEDLFHFEPWSITMF